MPNTPASFQATEKLKDVLLRLYQNDANESADNDAIRASVDALVTDVEAAVDAGELAAALGTYLQSVPAEYITGGELTTALAPYLQSVPAQFVDSTELTAALAPYLTSVPSQFVDSTEMAAALSGYLTSVPPETITETELSAALMPYLQGLPPEAVTADELASALGSYLQSVPEEYTTAAELSTALAPYLTAVPPENITETELTTALAPYLKTVPGQYIEETELTAALLPYLKTVPAEFLTEAEGDARYQKLGVGAPTVVSLGTDRANSTVTLADATGLSFPVEAGRIYRFRFLVVFDAAATTTGARFTLNGPNQDLLAYNADTPVATGQMSARLQNAWDSGSVVATSPYTTNNLAIVQGLVRPTAAGSVVLRFASEVAGSAITVKVGSLVEVS